MSDSSSSQARILVVEDEVLVRLFAVDALDEAGFKVEEAANATEALRAVERLKKELTAVIIDLGLPDRSGDEVAAEIRRVLAEVPILIASGRSERELREKFSGDRRVGSLVKPYTGPMLVEALASLGVAPRPAQ